MSELKVASLFEFEKVLQGRSNKLFYSKSEVDEVIAEKDKQIAELKEIDSKNRSAYYKDLSMMAKDVERHKYLRCLDQAKICELRLQRYEQYVTKYKDCNGPTIQRWIFLKCHYDRWHNRWLELAEKFKEEK